MGWEAAFSSSVDFIDDRTLLTEFRTRLISLLSIIRGWCSDNSAPAVIYDGLKRLRMDLVD